VIKHASLAPLAAVVAALSWLLGAALFLAAYSTGGLGFLERVLFALFLIGLAWLAWPFATALIGLWVMASNRLEREAHAAEPIRSRTALLAPIYNENAAEVLDRLGRMVDAIAEQGAADAFDVFVLSDSTNPQRRANEERALAAFLAERPGARIYYRRRPKNTDHKSGNIAEWVGRWGGAYEFMIVLDADSLMSAETLIELVRRMERRPDLGLLQTPPAPVGSETLFGRFLQFAAAAYAPAFARGLSRVMTRDGVYWGHNAIIRVRAFAALCGLPKLGGKPPFGGPILSHDFVEGALLRRGGYAVEIAADLAGSYETAPPNLAVYAKRDRRWAQGNLQHIRLLAAPGLTLGARLNMFLGAFAYLASPLWLLFLVVAVTHAWIDARVPSVYFPPERTLFPIWNPQPGPASVWLIVLILAMLSTPRLLVVLWLCTRPERRRFGGTLAVIGGFFAELVFSTLLAPVLMALQTKTVFEILLGRDSGWSATDRADGGVAFSTALRMGLWPMALGALLSLAALTTSTLATLWVLPIAAPLLLAPGLIWLTGSRAAGGLARRLGLFLTPSEISPEPILRRREPAAALPAGVAPEPATAG
jgi:membrane glycosyltransferase